MVGKLLKKFRCPTKNNIFSVFMVWVFPIHFWAFIIFLHDLPGFLMHYQSLEIVSILAYIMAFALLESFVATIILTSIACFLPHGWLLDNFTTKALIFVTITSLWLAFAHYWLWTQSGGNEMTSSYQEILSNGWGMLTIWLTTYIVVIISLLVILNQSQPVKKILGNIVDRISVTSFLFLLIDVLSIGIIVIRNI